MWVVLHAFETEVDCEVSPTGVALENLNITVLVVPQSVLDYARGLAIETSVDCDWLNDHILLHFGT
jgi:hypothetical protein